MSQKPIFVATHPRACSTAFERVFMTRQKTLQCVHEPFGDAYYFGPERLAERYENDPETRKESGYSESTYRTIFDHIARENSEGKRAFIKDMAQYWIPPNGKPATVAPSLANYRRGVGTDTTALSPVQTRTNTAGPPYPYDTKGEPNNPTVIPADLLATYHFTFLIRHPKYSIPSYYRCTIPPLDKMTGFYNFRPDEAGYEELRRLFDYLRNEGQIGPKFAGQTEANGQAEANGHSGGVEICVIDADDLLDNPSGIIEAYCKSTGIKWEPEMLIWDTEEDQNIAKEAFEKWKGFHEDALDSDRLRARTHKKAPKSDEQLFAEWTEKYGEEGAKVIRDTVAENVDHYEYLKQFTIKV
ncbi:Nn.00g007510.m01.CDS01 [Neocucurbitaria sp. VM-36]